MISAFSTRRAFIAAARTGLGGGAGEIGDGRLGRGLVSGASVKVFLSMSCLIAEDDVGLQLDSRALDASL